MNIALVVLSILLALVLVGSAAGKLTKAAPIIAMMDAVGVPQDKLPLLAVVEIAGAGGLIGGLFWWPIGLAAAFGVVLYFAGAVIAHLRVKDTKNVAPAAVLFLLAAGEVVLRVATKS